MHKRQTTVAVVDDDPNILGSVRELLNANGFITEPFASAEGFLSSGVIPRVDCLLLDIQLAGASGIELRDHLEACGSKLPVIFMTGLVDEILHRQALNPGCVALLHKPFLEHQLIDAIEKAVAITRKIRLNLAFSAKRADIKSLLAEGLFRELVRESLSGKGVPSFASNPQRPLTCALHGNVTSHVAQPSVLISLGFSLRGWTG